MCVCGRTELAHDRAPKLIDAGKHQANTPILARLRQVRERRAPPSRQVEPLGQIGFLAGVALGWPPSRAWELAAGAHPIALALERIGRQGQAPAPRIPRHLSPVDRDPGLPEPPQRREQEADIR